jgi:hypothetical protein
VFNSRGFPVNNNGTALNTDAIYVNNQNSIHGVTVSITGLTATWRHDRADTLAANWFHH